VPLSLAAEIVGNAGDRMVLRRLACA